MNAISVVYTSFEETLRAVRVGAALADRMGVPLRVVHFRTVPRRNDVDRPVGVSPVETDAFASRLAEDGISARVRVYLCRGEAKTIPRTFSPRSIVVLGGKPSWWPTRVERWRHALEAAGNLVVLVDPSESEEPAHA